jgi:hypothetical protein
MLKYFPVICKKHMAKTRLLKNVKSVKKGEILIVKPAGHGACSGVGVTVVTNNKELEDAKEINKKFNNIIVSEYIKNPLLFENKKCHIRMYILINSDLTWSFWKRGKAMTAEFDYIKDDWTNKKIHDSHGLTTFKDIYFPQDILPQNKIENILSQIKIILTAVAFIIEKHIKCYEESKLCCEIFGIDFIITDDYIVKLIEINAEAGYGSKNEDLTIYKQYCSEYFDWFYSNSLVPLLFNNNNIRYIKPDINNKLKPDINNKLKPDINNKLKPDINNKLKPDINNKLTNIVSNNKLTYIIADKEIETENEFVRLLNSKGFIRKDINDFPSYVDLFFSRNYKFFYTQLKNKQDYNKIFNIKSNLKSFFWRDESYKKGKDIIINKYQLYKNMVKHNVEIANKHMAKTFNILKKNNNIKDTVYIIRAVGKSVGSGEGVEYVSNKNELELVINKYKNNNKYKKIIASEYINNLLLYDNKKFHIRVHILFLYHNGKISYSTNLHGRILCAKKNFVNSNYDDLEIHDTHGRFSKRNIYFPEEFNYGKENTNKVLSQMELILSNVAEIINPHLKCFDTSQNCFEVFGIDFMIEKDFNVILIEINDEAGNPSFPIGNKEDIENNRLWFLHIKDYVKWIYDNAISKVL